MLTQKHLKSILHYNPDTGVFRWIERARGRKLSHAGTICKQQGYVKINYGGKIYRAHRLAWLYVHGIFPEAEIDHINHNRSDNRLKNLRAVPSCENHKNRTISRRNSSGFNGVCWMKGFGKWASYIGVGGEKIMLGYFNELSDAVLARLKADIKYGYHKNHGENK